MVPILMFAIGWVIGLVTASFTLVSVGIILFFGIPQTKKLTASGILQKDSPIQKHYYISLLLLTAIYAGALAGVYFWSSYVLTGFIVATGMSLLFSLGKLGANPNNISDYMETNKRYFIQDAQLQEFPPKG